MNPTRDLTKPGCVIAGAVSILLAIGLATIYVTDTHYAAGHDGPANAARQFVYILASLVVVAIIIRLGYHAVLRHTYLLFALATLFLVPPLIAKLTHSNLGGFVPSRNGAHRWIQLPGVQLQPSEFMKVVYVLTLAWYLRYRNNYRRLGGLLLPFLIFAIPLGLILIEPDLGTVLLLIPVLFVMLFVAGARLRHLALIATIGIAAVPFAWDRIEAYQRLRVTAVLLQSESLRRDVIAHPDRYHRLATRRQALEWSAGTGYQLVHSKNAMGSGGMLGYGWGRGPYVEYPLLPDRHNDFVFAVVGHQWGFFGCVTVLLCYFAITLAGVRIASATPDPSGRLLAVGIVTLIGTQAVVNMGMSSGLIPTTGMTLPFVSHGGSSLLSGFMCLGLLISIARHRPFTLAAQPFEFTERDTVPHHPADQKAVVPGVIGPWSPARGPRNGTSVVLEP